MRKSRVVSSVFVIFLFLLLVACDQNDATPTAEVSAATSAAATSAPTDTPSPPPATSTPQPTGTATATATAEPTPEPTVRPTATAEPTAEPTVIPLAIAQPTEDTEVMVGTELTVSGQAQPGGENELRLQLEVVSQELVNDTVNIDATTGRWTIAVEVPSNVTGPAQLTVGTPDGENAVTVALQLRPDPNAAGLTLRRPAAGDSAVAGYTLFFEGRVRDPVDDTVTIGVLTEDCSISVAQQSFTVTGGPWHGLVVLPQGIEGSACAVAYTGNDQEEWREARVPIQLLSAEDEGATMIALGNPAGTTFQAGEEAVIFGVAINAPNTQVQLTVTGQDQTEPVAQGTATVGSFGFWQAELVLPTDVSGPVTVTAVMGDDNTYMEASETMTVVP